MPHIIVHAMNGNLEDDTGRNPSARRREFVGRVTKMALLYFPVVGVSALSQSSVGVVIGGVTEMDLLLLLLGSR